MTVAGERDSRQLNREIDSSTCSATDLFNDSYLQQMWRFVHVIMRTNTEQSKRTH